MGTRWGRVAEQSGRQSLWLLWVEWEGLAGEDRVGLELRQFSPVAMVAEPRRQLGEGGCLPRKRAEQKRGWEETRVGGEDQHCQAAGRALRWVMDGVPGLCRDGVRTSGGR